MTEGYVSLHLSEAGIALAQVSYENDQAIVTTCEFRQCTSESQPAEITKLVEDLELETEPVVLVLPSHAYELFLVSAITDTGETRFQAMAEAVKDFLDYPVEQAILDYMPLSENPSPSDKGYVLAVPAEYVDTRVEWLEAAGLKVKAVDMAEFSLARIGAYLPEAKVGGLLLGLQSQRSMLLGMNQQGITVMRHVDLDLSAINLDDELDPLRAKAQKEKLIEDLSAEVTRSELYLQQTLQQSGTSHFLIAQTHHDIDSILTSLEEKIGRPCRVFKLNEAIHFNQSTTDEHQSRCLLAIGGALRATDKGAS